MHLVVHSSSGGLFSGNCLWPNKVFHTQNQHYLTLRCVCPILIDVIDFILVSWIDSFVSLPFRFYAYFFVYIVLIVIFILFAFEIGDQG